MRNNPAQRRIPGLTDKSSRGFRGKCLAAGGVVVERLIEVVAWRVAEPRIKNARYAWRGYANAAQPLQPIAQFQQLEESVVSKLHPIFEQALAPFASSLTEAERQEIDAAMHQDKQACPGKPLVDGYEQRRQDNAMRLQIQHQHPDYS